ncbi:maker401 [Drosophila busckii]|uniref:Maker401 n=1 Tax=Drosophila busckii TaxID=30019 RepID=A0A0M5IVZ0_DROBS|nr:maker401 [Drosophila busckii]
MRWLDIGITSLTSVERQNMYEETADVYSFGMVLWEVMAQEIPFDCQYYDNNERQDINAVKNTEISKQIKQMIELCWHQNSDARPSMKSLEDKLNTYLPIHLKGCEPGIYSVLDLSHIKFEKGLAYLHGRDPIIMHRDVKPANMVLTSNYRKLKICDFGLVKSVASTNTVNIGSAVYTAPEIYNTKKYDEMCDVYSFGVMFWEVMSQRKPFENCTFEHLMNQVLIQKERPDINAVKNSEISEQIKEIIELCWQENSDARPSMKALEDKLNTYLSHFKLEKKLGQGSFGQVFMATWLGETVAVKQIRYDDEKCKKDVDKEVEFLSSLSHDNIIKLYGISHDSSPLEKRMHLIMEYAENGSLDAYIHTSGQTLEFENLLNLMCQCVKGLAYLHGSEPIIMHRDVKPANMVLTSNYRKLKICDFGLVKSIASKNTEYIGSIPYRAPEIYITNEYVEKCDVYSFGIMLWEVMSQRKPFENCEVLNLMYQVAANKKRPDINALKYQDKHIKTIITKCWDIDPDDRPSMEELEEMINIFE